MEPFNRAVFTALALANIPPKSWDCQIFETHKKHAGNITAHQSQPMDGDIATLSFVIEDAGVSHTIAATCNISNGYTTFTIDGGENLKEPTGFPQLVAGLQASGSQVWYRYDDNGTLREYRLHTHTNLTFLANVLHLNGLPELAKVILGVIGIG